MGFKIKDPFSGAVLDFNVREEHRESAAAKARKRHNGNKTNAERLAMILERVKEKRRK